MEQEEGRGRTQGKPSMSKQSKAKNNSWHPSTSRGNMQGSHGQRHRDREGQCMRKTTAQTEARVQHKHEQACIVMSVSLPEPAQTQARMHHKTQARTQQEPPSLAAPSTAAVAHVGKSWR